ncbi:MAG: ATP-binding cassette domain-containing protein [Nevskiaceae bacterium]|nr:MAG: ATP-binding cassette domain-containing protein [Nevskiaceae bacterium]TBR74408.1 MAG: ATP-binding cassette domain-containing protein [Nevskiaceae bacterium]
MTALPAPAPRALLSIRRLRVPGRVLHHKAQPCVPIAFFDLDLQRGESLVIAGESGSGKSALARAIAGLEPAATGSIRLENVEMLDGAPASTRETWPSRAQLVARQPLVNESPRVRVATAIERRIKSALPKLSRSARQERIATACHKLGLTPDMTQQRLRELDAVGRYRVTLAAALGCAPKILICDEPLADHEEAERDAIRTLIIHTCAEQHLTLIVTALTAAAWRPFIRRINILCSGRVMEQGSTVDVLDHPVHPYTRALFSTPVQTVTPRRGPAHAELRITGPTPDPDHPPIGCVFHPRCPIADLACVREVPPLRRTGQSPLHYAACLFLEPVADTHDPPPEV